VLMSPKKRWAVRRSSYASFRQIDLRNTAGPLARPCGSVDDAGTANPPATSRSILRVCGANGDVKI
jgi:hypothetical protein